MTPGILTVEVGGRTENAGDRVLIGVERRSAITSAWASGAKRLTALGLSAECGIESAAPLPGLRHAV